MQDKPSRGTVLVVDDEASMSSLIRKTLRREGFETATASRGAEALEWLKKNRAELMLLDLKLPDMSGSEVVEALKEAEISVPFIIVTGHGDERVAVDMMKRGARDYLVKDRAFLDLLIPVVEQVVDQLDRERRLAEAERALRAKDSLVRLGEMAAVVAHEIKNPLAAISGAIQVIGSQLPSESPHKPIIVEILKRVDGLNNTVSDLLFFARPRPPHLMPIPIRTLLEETVSLLLQDPNFSGVEVDLSGREMLINGDAELLKPVFLNLFVNAAEAMEGAGKISVAVENSGSQCKVEVGDTGPGIPPEHQEKIFEPFFTTKSQGTGLGLCSAKRIIEGHEGRIALLCPPGGGTRVVVQLPLKEQGVAVAQG